MTTHYIQYGSQRLTCRWRDESTLVVRLATPGQAILVRMGDTLLITDKRDKPLWSCRVGLFTPRLRYGGFTRSGIVKCESVADLRINETRETDNGRDIQRRGDKSNREII